MDGLKKDTEYEFRVRAKNVAGLGNPSESTGSVLVKPKYSESQCFINRLSVLHYISLIV